MDLNKYTEARKQAKLTHAEIARRMSLTRQGLYNKIENDTLTIIEVRALMKILNRPLTWFFR